MNARSRNSTAYFGRWNVRALYGLGAPEELATFARLKNPKERRTLADWKRALSNRDTTADEIIDGVRYARVRAYGSRNSGQEIVIPENVQSPKHALNIFRYGDWIPHSTYGAIHLPKYIFDVNKSPEQMANEADEGETLSCTVGTQGTDCEPIWTPPFFQCKSGGAILERLKWAQAPGYARHNKKTIKCRGIGPREGKTYTFKSDGQVVDTTPVPAPPDPNKLICPRKNFPDWGVVKGESDFWGGLRDWFTGTVHIQVPVEERQGVQYVKLAPDEANVSRASADKWVAEHPCQEMICRNEATDLPERFYSCPTITPPPAGPGGLFAGLGPIGIAGLLGGVVLTIIGLTQRE